MFECSADAGCRGCAPVMIGDCAGLMLCSCAVLSDDMLHRYVLVRMALHSHEIACNSPVQRCDASPKKPSNNLRR